MTCPIQVKSFWHYPLHMIPMPMSHLGDPMSVSYPGNIFMLMSYPGIISVLVFYPGDTLVPLSNQDDSSVLLSYGIHVPIFPRNTSGPCPMEPLCPCPIQMTPVYPCPIQKIPLCLCLIYVSRRSRRHPFCI